MTNKSILVVDTPERCIDCDLFYRDDEDCWVCYPEWLQADKYPADDAWNFNPFKERLPGCPLISMEHLIQKTKEVLEEVIQCV